MKKALGWILESDIFSAKKSGSVRLESNAKTRRAAQTEPDARDKNHLGKADAKGRENRVLAEVPWSGEKGHETTCPAGHRLE